MSFRLKSFAALWLAIAPGLVALHLLARRGPWPPWLVLRRPGRA